MDMTKIDRINTLYHKAKATGLSEEELKEQADLRKEYIATLRANLRGTLNNVSIQEADGTVTDLGKKHGNVSDMEN